MSQTLCGVPVAMAIAEAVVERTLAEADLDNDGALSLEEFSAYLGGQPTLLRSSCR